ncbi:MAG TPA: TetR/AcrR family transcriptional regulator [Burkholderiaceae bacterium]|nr:TetR/AcrR family transcriptional regulator [Burkholderiaceae bacterium]
MARSRSADYDSQRDRILALAVRAFAETGYASATMAALATACGTSKARLYHYYPSKEAILFDSLDRYTARLCELVADVRAQRLPARDELHALVRALLVEYRHSREYHVALLNDVKFLDEPKRERIRSREREIVEALADTLERAWPQRVRGSQCKPMTMALLGMVNFTFAWLRPDGPMSYEQYAELVIDLWENGLQGAGVRPSSSQPDHRIEYSAIACVSIDAAAKH